MTKILFQTFICCLLCAALHAQKADTLEEIKVHDRRAVSADARINDFSSGQKIKSIDSTTLAQYRMQSMAGLLAQQTPVFVKSYGFNGLATLNFRGSSAAQSAVIWNGIPIQNAALGIADVSTLPVFFMNKVNIVYGGSSAMWGSGNVGGALVMENEVPVFDSSRRAISSGAGAGSFSQSMGSFRGSISGRRWYCSASIFAQMAQNDFSYINDAGVSAHMPNSRLESVAALLHAAYKIDAQNTISLTAWYQQYNRQIPPELQEPYSVKQQQDGSLRLLADWQRTLATGKLYAKASLVRDEQRYDDSAILLHMHNAVYQYYQECGWKKRWGASDQLLVFVPVQLSWLQPSRAMPHAEQRKVALAAAYSKNLWNRLEVTLNARGESITPPGGNTLSIGYLLPGAGVAYRLADWLTLRANAQKTYRAPTLNELYYFPGGNSSLKPEQGWSEDAGYTLKSGHGRFTFYHDLSVFTRDIHDWIIWIGGAIWTPHNIAEVHSRGVETENYITFKAGPVKLHLGLNTAYVLATTASSYIYNDGSVGKQIPYTPRYNGQLNAGLTWGRFSVNYNHTYTGYRFTTSDESYYMQPYQTGNIQLSYSHVLRKDLWHLIMQCNNIWNERYQVVAFRPMPGINWLAGLGVDIGAWAQ